MDCGCGAGTIWNNDKGGAGCGCGGPGRCDCAACSGRSERLGARPPAGPSVVRGAPQVAPSRRRVRGDVLGAARHLADGPAPPKGERGGRFEDFVPDDPPGGLASAPRQRVVLDTEPEIEREGYESGTLSTAGQTLIPTPKAIDRPYSVVLRPGYTYPRRRRDGPVNFAEVLPLLNGQRDRLRRVLRPAGSSQGRRTARTAAGRASIRPEMIAGVGRYLQGGAPAGPGQDLLGPCSRRGDQFAEYLYRSVRFEVKQEWLDQYKSDCAQMGDGHADAYGLASSVEDTLDYIWAPFRGAARGRHSELHRLLGCWNLPRSSDNAGDAYDFWRGGWGAPHKVFLYAVQLIRTYGDDLSYDDGSGYCEGFDSFVKALVRGDAVYNSDLVSDDKHRRCYLTVNYRNADSRYADGAVRDPCYGTAKCSKGMFRKAGSSEWCAGRDYDDWSPWFVTDNGDNCYDGYTGGDLPTSCGTPGTDCGNTIAVGGTSYKITFGPADLAFRGYVCDKVLWMARLAMDYGMFLASEGCWETAPKYIDDAIHLGRYALRIIADHASAMIHEMGHVYLGGGHCSWSCCFEEVSEHWLCKVRGRLGLPFNRFDTQGSDDWVESKSAVRNDQHACGGGKNPGYMIYMCDTIRNGVVGQESDFCSFGCLRKILYEEFGPHEYLDVDVDDICPAPVRDDVTRLET